MYDTNIRTFAQIWAKAYIHKKVKVGGSSKMEEPFGFRKNGYQYCFPYLECGRIFGSI